VRDNSALGGDGGDPDGGSDGSSGSKDRRLSETFTSASESPTVEVVATPRVPVWPHRRSSRTARSAVSEQVLDPIFALAFGTLREPSGTMRTMELTAAIIDEGAW
jgi:hypothetical protein